MSSIWSMLRSLTLLQLLAFSTSYFLQTVLENGLRSFSTSNKASSSSTSSSSSLRSLSSLSSLSTGVLETSISDGNPNADSELNHSSGSSSSTTTTTTTVLSDPDYNPWDFQSHLENSHRNLQTSTTVACPTGARLPPGVMSTRNGCQCAAGFIQSGSGNDLRCTACPSGFFSTTPGFTGPFCRSCPANSGSDPSAQPGTPLTTCTCFAGYRQTLQNGVVRCDQCPSGFFSSVGDSLCTPCPPGGDSLVGSGSCYCKPGYTQSGTGPSLSCTLCAFNFYWVANACKSRSYTYTTQTRGSSRGPFLSAESNNIQGACYTYINQPTTWSSAVFACNRLSNGWLVTINNRGQNNFVSSTSSRNPTWIGINNIGVTLDPTQSPAAIAGTYRWVHGQGSGFTSWMTGQPNAFTTGTSTQSYQRCGMMGWFNNAFWNDWYCNQNSALQANFQGPASFGYVCESDLQPTCVPCPANSFSTQGAISCMCQPGFFAIGSGTSLVCSRVPGPTLPTVTPTVEPSPLPSTEPTIAPTQDGTCPQNAVSFDGSCVCDAGFTSTFVDQTMTPASSTVLTLTCEACPVNTWSMQGAFANPMNGAIVTDCQPCPPNSGNTSDQKRCLCNPGFRPISGWTGSMVTLRCVRGPSVSPTRRPTASPTKSAATFRPSCVPSVEPSARPTRIPTSVPTRIPTSVPTRIPTSVPTPRPVADQTRQPTRRPSPSPSSIPTQQPTPLPSTLRPSPIPTAIPTTRQPSSTPLPSRAPTLTAAPTMCPPNSQFRGGTCVCNPGFMQTGSGWGPTAGNVQCSGCPAGFYRDSAHPNSGRCISCPANAGSFEGALTCTCFPGYFASGFGNTLYCSECPASYYAPVGSTACIPCPPGSTSVIGSGSCFCGTGFSQNGTGFDLACDICPANSFTATGCKSGYTFVPSVNGQSRGQNSQISGGCYKAISKPLAWTAAVLTCDSYNNGWVVTVDNGGENRYIDNAFNNPGGMQWIGYSNLATNDSYSWVHGTGTSYSNWYPGQPSRFSDQHCVTLGWWSNALWNDYYCSPQEAPANFGAPVVLPYVCESDVIFTCIKCPRDAFAPVGSFTCQCNPGFVPIGSGSTLRCQIIEPGLPIASPTRAPIVSPTRNPTGVAPLTSCKDPNAIILDSRCVCIGGYVDKNYFVRPLREAECEVCGASSYSLTGAQRCTQCPVNSNSASASTTCICRSGFVASGTGATLVCLSLPSAAPSLPPTLFPSASPSLIPTRMPTVPPFVITCPNYAIPSGTSTNNALLNFVTCPPDGGRPIMGCGGDVLQITNCPSLHPQAICTGSTYARLFEDDAKATEVAPLSASQVGPPQSATSGCTSCTNIIYRIPLTARGCQSFKIGQGCLGGTSPCVGRFVVFGASGPPSFAPTYVPGAPTPFPTARPSFTPRPTSSAPTPTPTSLPTQRPTTPAPTVAPIFCPRFDVNNTDSASNSRSARCSFRSCEGSVIFANGCPGSLGLNNNWITCVGNTFTRLLNAQGVEVLNNDDANCGTQRQCSSLRYPVPAGTGCQTYTLLQGCLQNSACSGSFVVTGADAVPTALPTIRPSPLPSTRPTLSPTAEPTILGKLTSRPTTFAPSPAPSAQPTPLPGSPTAIPTARPTQQPVSSSPTFLPSAQPSFRPGAPTPEPTLPQPTFIPTQLPTVNSFNCPTYSISNTNGGLQNFATCQLFACGGTLITVNGCPTVGINGGLGGTGVGNVQCKGDTHFRLFDSAGTQVQDNDDYQCAPNLPASLSPSATPAQRDALEVAKQANLCSLMKYNTPPTSSCQVYTVRFGCFGNTACSGNAQVFGALSNPTTQPTVSPDSPSPMPISVPTNEPISTPTRRPSFGSRVPTPLPSPLPTASPSLAGVRFACSPFVINSNMNTQNDLSNFATCTFYACSGARVTISNCPSPISPQTSCSGDTFLRVFTVNNGNPVQVAFNDDGPEADNCRLCSQVRMVTTGQCQNYLINQGCFLGGSCSGTVVVTGAVQPPTMSPTYIPGAPTPRPTAAPTTVAPSPVPSTAAPTLVPTPLPSGRPTLRPTPLPSTEPTVRPTQPTMEPTARPTLFPTPSPSRQPTPRPSSEPTLRPSPEPSARPTREPTSSPTTRTPTPEPSLRPSPEPSARPSPEPTFDPSRRTNNPTVVPTFEPSASPTLSPSRSPSVRPTLAPSRPTVTPSFAPTYELGAPTLRPTVSPTQSPTVLPSASPTVTPTQRPSRRPTLSPTPEPTFSPSAFPSPEPSPIPTPSPPTRRPTPRPTPTPIAEPSFEPTLFPTIEPTPRPSARPTARPSCQPTTAPTFCPSAMPSITPTVMPSAVPTRSPTASPTTPTAVPTMRPTFTLGAPTPSPTLSPTCQPTTRPTLSPSVQPSLMPTRAPSVSPTSVPTTFPSAPPSPEPTALPTPGPSFGPTLRPTWAPSFSPTVFPSNEPSASPTAAPTIRPTRSPTPFPSAFPTAAPSSSPTVSPTARPTPSPTLRPTNAPTNSPTASPTARPTARPTPSPTLVPTPSPSVSPTRSPTRPPTVNPTARPTTSPTASPTATPTVRPTSSPTARPTASPTARPTSSPTLAPTGVPTCRPTPKPSFQPTASPTRIPTTALPTGQPTRQPTRQPSGQPSRQPTGQPSRQPSLQPTSQPSRQPTGQPSRQPTMQPSRQPTRRPTRRPSGQPSRQPTRQPSAKPSHFPTSQPTGRPTEQPNARPSRFPTMQPSSQPSSQPSLKPFHPPTSQPSGQPTHMPLSHPTSKPSAQSTGQPSTQPTSQPTSHPSSIPSSKPSRQPTGQPTDKPTDQPTAKPSHRPSEKPTGQPSRQPTGKPSHFPTSQPTHQPTRQPSGQPSRQPSRQPTRQPTRQPSGQPTGQPVSHPTSRPTSDPTTTHFPTGAYVRGSEKYNVPNRINIIQTIGGVRYSCPPQDNCYLNNQGDFYTALLQTVSSITGVPTNNIQYISVYPSTSGLDWSPTSTQQRRLQNTIDAVVVSYNISFIGMSVVDNGRVRAGREESYYEITKILAKNVARIPGTNNSPFGLLLTQKLNYLVGLSRDPNPIFYQNPTTNTKEALTYCASKDASLRNQCSYFMIDGPHLAPSLFGPPGWSSPITMRPSPPPVYGPGVPTPRPTQYPTSRPTGLADSPREMIPATCMFHVKQQFEGISIDDWIKFVYSNNIILQSTISNSAIMKNVKMEDVGLTAKSAFAGPTYPGWIVHGKSSAVMSTRFLRAIGSYFTSSSSSSSSSSQEHESSNGAVVQGDLSNRAANRRKSEWYNFRGGRSLNFDRFDSQNNYMYDRRMQAADSSLQVPSIFVNYTVKYAGEMDRLTRTCVEDDNYWMLVNSLNASVHLPGLFAQVFMKKLVAANSPLQYGDNQGDKKIESWYIEVGMPFQAPIQSFYVSSSPTVQAVTTPTDNTELNMKIAILVSFMCVFFVCACVVGFFYYRRYRQAKDDAFEKWSEIYGSDAIRKSTAPAVFGKRETLKFDSRTASPMDSNVMTSAAKAGGADSLGDAFESQNPAFGTVRRASALPNANISRKSAINRPTFSGHDPENDHGRESRLTIHHDFSTAEHFTRGSEQIETSNPIFQASSGGGTLTPLLDPTAKKSSPLFSPSPGGPTDVSASLAETYPEQHSPQPQFQGVPPPPARKSRRSVNPA